ncbi:Hsp70 family protein [Mycobacterium sp.]|uniref:Hsp70 family protein n=1 Tax=Mycobacterium sp. TaxID=1785 RepID=UPI002C51F79D|nr:Hsp70 family protein [Mycobacterium sp.]HTQ21933.1 Hsp70 family protein [Mycobacterium sp.]
MAERRKPALGLSIGATNLAAVTADHAITRKPVLTLYRQRPPEVGVPSENPRLDEPGLVISDFVDRVGDPVGIVATDGSVHRSEALVADGLRALAYTATGGRPLPEHVAVTYPAHWGPKAVDALASALSRVSEWSNRARPLTLLPDAAATLCAVRANPGIPARGIVAVCDFGGSGTSITLVDAAGDYLPVAPTLRHHDFSGDLVDQALLTTVMDDMPSTGSFDPAGTSAIGSLSRLRAGCRSAKEQLSLSTVTTLSDDLGSRADIRLTRNELDDAIRDSLNNFTAVLEEALVRNGIRGSDLVAVVSVGGGANLPAVTTMLSGRLRVPVVTTPRPQLTAAIGGALRAARGPRDDTETVMTPAAPAKARSMAPLAMAGVSGPSALAAPASGVSVLPADPVARQLPVAWSEADDESGGMPAGTGYTAARPALKFEREEPARPEPKSQLIPWYRLPWVVITGALVAVVLVGTAVAIGMNSGNTPAPGVNTTPASSPPASPAPAPPPAVGQSAPASAQPQASGQPAPQQAPQSPEAAPPAAPPAAQLSPAPQAPPVPQGPPPVVPPIPALPPIPHIPGIGAPIPGVPHPAGHH